MKFNLILISLLTGKCATHSSILGTYVILVESLRTRNQRKDDFDPIVSR